jgi:hypothetical protein
LWNQGEGSLEVRFHDRKREHVLIDYEVPHLVTLRDDSSRYLALYSDEDERFVRWIHAPMSDLEWHALLRGILPMRDVFRKSPVWLIDELPDGTPMRGQEIDGGDIDDESLPTEGALLPTAAREAFKNELPVLPDRMLRFESRKKSSRALLLKAIGKGTLAYQRLWTACAAPANDATDAKERADLERRSHLLAVAPKAASFGIELAPTDPELFAVIAERVARLIASSDNHTELTKFFREFPGSRTAYESFLRALQENDLDVLVSWRSGGAFMSGGRSKSARAAIGRTAAATDSIFSVQGYFRGFMKGSKRFEFYDPEADTTYAGDVSKRLQGTEAKVVISDEDVHKVTIVEHVVTTPDGEESSEYELQEFAPVPASDFSSSKKS